MRRTGLLAVAMVAAAGLLATGGPPSGQPTRAPARPPASPSAGSLAGPTDPREALLAYIGHLENGQPYLAIDEFLDPQSFLESAFGDELKALSPPEQAYMRQLACVLFKTAVTVVPMDEMLRETSRTEPEIVSRTDTEATLRMVLENRARRVRHESGFVFRLVDNRWKIADLSPLADTVRRESKTAKEHDGVGPLTFMELLVESTLSRKLQAQEERAAANLQREADAARREVEETTKRNLEELRRAQQKPSRKP